MATAGFPETNHYNERDSVVNNDNKEPSLGDLQPDAERDTRPVLQNRHFRESSDEYPCSSTSTSTSDTEDKSPGSKKAFMVHHDFDTTKAYYLCEDLKKQAPHLQLDLYSIVRKPLIPNLEEISRCSCIILLYTKTFHADEHFQHISQLLVGHQGCVKHSLDIIIVTVDLDGTIIRHIRECSIVMSNAVILPYSTDESFYKMLLLRLPSGMPVSYEKSRREKDHLTNQKRPVHHPRRSVPTVAEKYSNRNRSEPLPQEVAEDASHIENKAYRLSASQQQRPNTAVTPEPISDNQRRNLNGEMSSDGNSSGPNEHPASPKTSFSTDVPTQNQGIEGVSSSGGLNPSTSISRQSGSHKSPSERNKDLAGGSRANGFHQTEDVLPSASPTKTVRSLPIVSQNNATKPSFLTTVPSSVSTFAGDAQPKNESQPTAPKVSTQEEGLETKTCNEQNDQPSAKAKSGESALTVGSELQHSADQVKKTSTTVVTEECVKEEEMYGSGDGSGPDEETIAKVSAADSTNPCRPPTTTEDVVEEDAEPGFPSAMPSPDEAGKITAEKEGDGTEGEQKGRESSMQILDIEASAAGTSDIEKMFEKDVDEKTFSDSEPNNNSYRRRIEIEPASQTEKLRGRAPLNCQDNFERMMPLKTSEEASGGFQPGEEPETHDTSLWDSPHQEFKGLRGPQSPLELASRPWPPQKDTLNYTDLKVSVQGSRPEPTAPPYQKPHGDFLDQYKAPVKHHVHTSLPESKILGHNDRQWVPTEQPTCTTPSAPKPNHINTVINVNITRAMDVNITRAMDVIITNEQVCREPFTSDKNITNEQVCREPLSDKNVRRGGPTASDEPSANSLPIESDPLATDDISNDEAPSSPKRKKSFFGSLLCCGNFRQQPSKTKNLEKTTLKPTTIELYY